MVIINVPVFGEKDMKESAQIDFRVFSTSTVP